MDSREKPRSWQAAAGGGRERGPQVDEEVVNMEEFLAELRAELAELPPALRERWWRWFWQAWPAAGGDGQRAAAQAWAAFAREAKGQAPAAAEGEDFERLFAEAVARGWLLPEQKPWAAALVRQNWAALREFLDLAAANPVSWEPRAESRESRAESRGPRAESRKNGPKVLPGADLGGHGGPPH